jgi:16S rRNA G527 N7-methylase RsmG
LSGLEPTFDWPTAIGERARRAGLDLPPPAIARLAAHAALVLERNPLLHLTSLTEPSEFVERHIGESLEGAALLPPDLRGTLVDLGSGNGYPGIPMAIARQFLRPILAEASQKKADFLRRALEAADVHGDVLERQVVRAADLIAIDKIDVLVTRAMGGWERVVPKLAVRLGPDGRVLLWTTVDAATITARAAWRGLETVATHALPGRERSSIVVLRKRS